MKGAATAVAVVIGGAGLAVLASCGAGADRQPAGLSAEVEVGRQAYQSLDCGSCHGDHREGKRSGPALTGLAAHWAQESLVSYLEDPPAMIRATPRLAYKAEQYPIAMPSFGDQAGDDTLRALAAYLLTD
jgi:mono/diheme cytochrome c family protein